ncbi:MAG: hypothetical protein PF439_00490 [Helicobacteraceae bacterium]|jgi:hypothetical protein|nr:hypothetical protein [Helicobacteraceae bacterium]
MLGFEIVAIISVISIFAWFIMAAKNTNSQNRFIDEDETDEKK